MVSKGLTSVALVSCMKTANSYASRFTEGREAPKVLGCRMDLLLLVFAVNVAEIVIGL